MSNTITLRFRGESSDLRRTLGQVGEDLTNFNSSTTLVAAGMAAVTAAVAAAPMIIGGALTSVVGLFGGIGIAAQLQNEKIKTAYKDLGKWLIEQTQGLSAPIGEAMMRIAERVKVVFGNIAPALGRIFQMTAPYVEVLANGIFRLVENAMPGFERAIRSAAPVVNAFHDGLSRLGDALTYFFTKMAENSAAGARGITALFDTINWLIKGLADLLVWLTNDAVALHAIHDAVMGVLPIILELFYQLEKALGPAFKALVPLVLDVARTIAAFLIPIFQALSGPLARVASALATELHPAFLALQQLFVTLNPLFVHIANIIGDLLVGAIRTVGPLLPPLINAFGDLVSHALNFVPPLLQIAQVLLPALEKIVTAVARAVITGLGPAFSALLDVFRTLMPIFSHVVSLIGDLLVSAIHTLAPLLPTLIRFFGDLVATALQLIPPLVRVAEALLPALVTVLNAVMQVVTPLLPILVRLASSFGDLLVAAIQTLTPLLPPLIGAIGEVVRILAESLEPILPIIIQAFKDWAPVLKDIAEKAGVLLVAAVRALAPLLQTLVQAALDLVKALLPVIPPLLEMANNAMPLVAGVIKDVLIPTIKWLVTEFVGLIDYGVKIIQKFGELSVAWRTYWDQIKAAFADANTKIRAGIEAFSQLPEIARRHWDAMYQAIKQKIGEILVDVTAFPGKMLDAILAPVKKFYDAGQSLMGAFADGINSKASAAQDAAGNVVGGTASLFPQSPAKTGPFSGRGYTDERGRILIQDFAKGIMDAAPGLAQVAAAALHGISGIFSGFTGGGGTVSASVPGVGSLQLKVAPGADSALASLLMNMVRTGQLQLMRA